MRQWAHARPPLAPPACQVELREDLVGSCVVGDVITVLGLVKVLATGDNKPSGERVFGWLGGWAVEGA